MSHTKEPWIYGVGDTEEFGMVFGVGLPTLPNWTVVAVLSPFDQLNELDEANASRIVACVNACAGIPTDDLERWGVSLIDKLREDEANNIARHSDLLQTELTRVRSVSQENFDKLNGWMAACLAAEKQRDQLLTAIINCRRTLEVVNEVPGGPINDTIWYGPAETLFDYMDSVIESASKIDFV